MLRTVTLPERAEAPSIDRDSTPPRYFTSLSLYAKLKVVSHEKFFVCTGVAFTMNSKPWFRISPTFMYFDPNPDALDVVTTAISSVVFLL